MSIFTSFQTLATFILGGTILVAASSKLFAADAPAADSKKTWVQFSSFTYTGTDPAADAVKADEFLNPILAGFYPDPSICRVAGDYYLVNSSFQYFPGIPIWHSKDLVNWTQLGNVIDRPSQYSSIKGGDVSRGMYAPTIRFHDGIFYVICTLVSGGGNFYVTSKNPKGPWSEPVFLKSLDGIDPSLFFDDDGKAYVMHCAPPLQGQQLYNGQRTIRLQELDLANQTVTGDFKVLVNGGTDISRQPQWCEGPHLYKRNGKYYLMCAEGGTGTAHAVVVWRADNVWGPYSVFDGNPVLSQRQLAASRPNPVTCTGHADLVETQNGQWFAVFLGCQPYQGAWFNTGRQTFMLPVKWENDWPVILPAGIAVPLAVKKPNLPTREAPKPPTHGSMSWTDKFDQEKLDFHWVMLRAPSSDWYSLKEMPGSVLIQPRPVALSAMDNPSYLATRQQHANFSASVIVNVLPDTARSEAGLVAFQNETHSFFAGVRIEGGKGTELFVEQTGSAGRGGGGRGGTAAHVVATVPLNGESKVELRIQGAGRAYSVWYRTDHGEYKKVGDDLDGSLLSTEVAGGFQGVTLGMYVRATQ